MLERVFISTFKQKQFKHGCAQNPCLALPREMISRLFPVMGYDVARGTTAAGRPAEPEPTRSPPRDDVVVHAFVAAFYCFLS